MVFNDLLLTVDAGNYVVLVLLDFAVAFNTIDLSVLFSRLDDVCGVQCKVLKWFKSYLTGRSMLVNIRASISAYDDHVGVPQGSVFAPLLFSLYMIPLGNISRNVILLFTAALMMYK